MIKLKLSANWPHTVFPRTYEPDTLNRAMSGTSSVDKMAHIVLKLTFLSEYKILVKQRLKGLRRPEWGNTVNTLA